MIDARIFIGEARGPGIKLPPGDPVLLVGHWEGAGPADAITWNRLARGMPEQSYDSVIFCDAEKLFDNRLKTWAHARRLASQASTVWMTLSAPPKRVADWWSLLEILEPGRWGTFWQYASRYCSPHKAPAYRGGKAIWRFEGRENWEELRARLAHIVVGLPEEDETSDAEELAVLGLTIRDSQIEEGVEISDEISE